MHDKLATNTRAEQGEQSLINGLPFKPGATCARGTSSTQAFSWRLMNQESHESSCQPTDCSQKLSHHANKSRLDVLPHPADACRGAAQRMKPTMMTNFHNPVQIWHQS